MQDWTDKLDAFLNINDREILTHAGKISHDLAKQAAETKYEEFHSKQLSESENSESDFDKIIQKIPTHKTNKSSQK